MLQYPLAIRNSVKPPLQTGGAASANGACHQDCNILQHALLSEQTFSHQRCRIAIALTNY
jgi:hypothetical protein